MAERWVIPDRRWPADVWPAVQARRQRMLAALEELCRERECVVFEQQLIPAEFARRQFRGMRWRGWFALLQLGVLVLGLLILTVFFPAVLAAVLGM